ncbi:methyl-accepting chemotaxis protein [Pseudomonas tumuqii]|uniref:methyl-accepting chemotaxis protein n=1 Tax=Pseudomonas tumuqii TaxID=2715755 RepID=UPI001553558C|nr:methyl-accepting chemotaxis protein [Pseudomonas tumuqii]
MKNWTLRRRLLASFALIIAIILVMVAISYAQLLSIEQRQRELQADPLPGLYYSDLIRSETFESILLIQRLVALEQGDGQALLRQLRSHEERLGELLGLYEKSLFRADDRATFAELQAHMREFDEISAALLAQLAQGNREQARQVLNDMLLPDWEHGRGLLDKLVELNHEAADSMTDGVAVAVARVENSMLLSLLLVVLVAVICATLLMRAILRPMQRIHEALESMRGGNLNTRLVLERQDEFGVIESGFNGMAAALTELVSQSQRSSIAVTTSVTEIAATSKQQQATATETAATTTEIGATSREIVATSRDLLRTMDEVSAAAEQAAVLADSGQLGLTRMEDTMHQVIGAAELVNAKLAILNEKAGNITQVVTTIVKVADQTNLLSLNAAIEAEKAGEYGRGFSVVASEVRRLADQTAVATYDIEQMVREIQSAVSAGVMGMDKFSEEVRRGMTEVRQVGEQLTQIIQQTQALAPRLSMVNEGMQAQASGAEQINQALVQLAEASGQTVESLRQTGSAIDELSQVANGLRSGVSRFQA